MHNRPFAIRLLIRFLIRALIAALQDSHTELHYSTMDSERADNATYAARAIIAACESYERTLPIDPYSPPEGEAIGDTAHCIEAVCMALVVSTALNVKTPFISHYDANPDSFSHEVIRRLASRIGYAAIDITRRNDPEIPYCFGYGMLG